MRTALDLDQRPPNGARCQCSRRGWDGVQAGRAIHEHRRPLGGAPLWEDPLSTIQSTRPRVSSPDLLIAATAERHAVTLLHYNADFKLIAEVTSQPVEWIAVGGALPSLVEDARQRPRGEGRTQAFPGPVLPGGRLMANLTWVIDADVLRRARTPALEDRRARTRPGAAPAPRTQAGSAGRGGVVKFDQGQVAQRVQQPPGVAVGGPAPQFLTATRNRVEDAPRGGRPPTQLGQLIEGRRP